MAEFKTVGNPIEIQTSGSTKVVISIVVNKGQEYLDIRTWVETSKYSGPTQKGVMVKMEYLQDILKALNEVVDMVG